MCLIIDLETNIVSLCRCKSMIIFFLFSPPLRCWLWWWWWWWYRDGYDGHRDGDDDDDDDQTISTSETLVVLLSINMVLQIISRLLFANVTIDENDHLGQEIPMFCDSKINSDGSSSLREEFKMIFLLMILWEKKTI